jgi:cytochrome P450
LTFDTLGDLAFGEPSGSLEGGEPYPWISLIFDTIKIGKKIWFLDEFPMTKKVIMFFMATSIKRRAADHYDLSITEVRERVARGVGDRGCLISYIMKTDGTGSTDDEMECNASTLIVAGDETTATTLSAATYFLLKRLKKYVRFTEEIPYDFKGGDEEITLQACAALPYLQACIEETLRLFPAVPIGALRQVTEGGGYIENIYLPEKLILDLSIGRAPLHCLCIRYHYLRIYFTPL